MSSRVGTAIPASRSTALSSSAVGLTRSIQTAVSGSEARSTATAFLSEKSEGTKTENILNSGTGYQPPNRTLLDSGKRLMTARLTIGQALWRSNGITMALIWRPWPICPIGSLGPQGLRQKGHNRQIATWDKALTCRIVKGFGDNAPNGL